MNGKKLTLAFYMLAGAILIPANTILISDFRHDVGIHPLAAVVFVTVAQVIVLALTDRRRDG